MSLGESVRRIGVEPNNGKPTNFVSAVCDEAFDQLEEGGKLGALGVGIALNDMARKDGHIEELSRRLIRPVSEMFNPCRLCGRAGIQEQADHIVRLERH
jgi:hypothetical protein